MGVAGKTILDSTLATIDGHDGASSTTIPVTLLSADEAALVGEYESFCSRERLATKLWCRDCGMEREMEVSIEPTQVAIKCDHRMLFYQGPVPLARVEHADLGESAGLAIVRVVIPEEPMPQADAYMQRKWTKFLKAYGLMEASWCLRCEDEGQQSGTRVEVGTNVVAILCRHRHYVFKGFTF